MLIELAAQSVFSLIIDLFIYGLIMSKYYLLLVLASWCLLWEELEATITQNNIDTVEPSVIRSPSRSINPDDGFGWAAIFHQVEAVSDTDSMEEVLRKTRYLCLIFACTVNSAV